MGKIILDIVYNIVLIPVIIAIVLLWIMIETFKIIKCHLKRKWNEKQTI